MSSRNTSDISSSLLRKGFRLSEGDHHRYIFYNGDSETTVRTKISHSGKDIGDTLISTMSKQLKMNKNDFLKFVDCKISKEEYTQYLKDNNFI